MSARIARSVFRAALLSGVAAAALLGGCRAILGIEEGFLESQGDDGGNADGAGGGDAIAADGGDAMTDATDANDADGPTCTEELYASEAVADTFIVLGEPGSFGGQDTLFVGQNANSVGLVTFSLVGDGGTFEGGVARLRAGEGLSAELRLQRAVFGASTRGEIGVHVVRADWTEGSGPNDGADWTKRTLAENWIVAGAQDPSERSAKSAGTVVVEVDGGPTTVRIPLSTLTDALQTSSATFTNGEKLSFALVPSAGVYVSINTRESVTNAPRLIIRGPCRDR